MWVRRNVSDVLVLGVGGMGSSACFHLAKRKVKVTGIEQYSIGHDRGSSHGETRMIRQAYFEHPDYVPLLFRAYDLWDEITQDSKEKLFHRTGIVYYGSKTSSVLSGIFRSASLHGLRVEKMDHKEALARFPGFLPDEEILYEPNAGYLEVENCVNAHARLARIKGAILFENEKVEKWSASRSGVEVYTNRATYHTKKLIITTGAWRSENMKELSLLTVHRNLLFWFNCDERYRLGNAPCFAYDLPYGFFYGFPQINSLGLKIAHHQKGEIVIDPAKVNREIAKGDQTQVLRCIKDKLPGVSSVQTKGVICLYTMSPDGNFIIDFHPEFPNVIFAAGFSGHGFKFASVIGEILADLALEGKTRHPISFLRLSRMHSPPR